jgi:hypothetical protein
MPACLEWVEERTQECDAQEDQGQNECTEWDEGCAEWGLFSFVCVVFTAICVGWTWVAHWVCVGWVWVTTAVCVLWDVGTTLANLILVTLESIFGWVLSALAFIIELIEMIPFVGALIRWVWNFVTWLVWTILSLPDALLGLIGVRPEKLLRVCTIILPDENGNPVASVDFARAQLQFAADIYKRDANVRLVPSGPFKYATGFLGAPAVTDDWIQVQGGNGDGEILDVPCNEAGSAADWGLVGSKYQAIASTRCFFGAWRRVLGYGAPITCLVIRTIPGGSAGCCLWITDYLTIGAQPPPRTFVPSRTLAHEAGHGCNLWHTCVDDDVNNLMGTQGACDPNSTTTPADANSRMENWQVLLVRGSKHVTYY